MAGRQAGRSSTTRGAGDRPSAVSATPDPIKDEPVEDGPVGVEADAPATSRGQRVLAAAVTLTVGMTDDGVAVQAILTQGQLVPPGADAADVDRLTQLGMIG